ncbi:hypothetical protein CSUI_000623, partial [Cystoisospora suis]
SPSLLFLFLCIASGKDGSDKEKTKKKGKGEEEDSEEESKEDEEEASADPDDDEESRKDGTFYIQLVRLSLSSPKLLPSLPGLAKNSPFYDLWKEDLNFSQLFLLDLDGSRFAPIASSSRQHHETTSSKQEEVEIHPQRKILSHLYQILESQQYQTRGEDDEDDSQPSHRKRRGGAHQDRPSQQKKTDERGEEEEEEDLHDLLVFEPLPDYCDGQRFMKKCLASAAPAWYWEVLASCLDLSFTQIALLLGVVACVYFFGSSLNSEVVVMLVLGGSLLAGGLSNLQSIFNFITGSGTGGRHHS